MCTYMNLIKCAVIHTAGMVHTVADGTLNALVFVLVHHHFLTTFIRDDISMTSNHAFMMEKNSAVAISSNSGVSSK